MSSYCVSYKEGHSFNKKVYGFLFYSNQTKTFLKKKKIHLLILGSTVMSYFISLTNTILLFFFSTEKIPMSPGRSRGLSTMPGHTTMPRWQLVHVMCGDTNFSYHVSTISKGFTIVIFVIYCYDPPLACVFLKRVY